jgi:hypothetical protein
MSKVTSRDGTTIAFDESGEIGLDDIREDVRRIDEAGA